MFNKVKENPKYNPKKLKDERGESDLLLGWNVGFHPSHQTQSRALELSFVVKVMVTQEEERIWLILLLILHVMYINVYLGIAFSSNFFFVYKKKSFIALNISLAWIWGS